MSPETSQAAPYAVVDASVTLKWVLDDEDHVTEAIGLRDAWLAGQIALVAPSLWRYEMLNGLLVAERKGRLQGTEAREAIGDLLALGLPLADPFSEAVYLQARRWNLTAYDGSYVALAAELEAVLWSGDRSLVRSLAGSGAAVRWIGDWPSEPAR